jgi:hypothetical protein
VKIIFNTITQIISRWTGIALCCFIPVGCYAQAEAIETPQAAADYLTANGWKTTDSTRQLSTDLSRFWQQAAATNTYITLTSVFHTEQADSLPQAANAATAIAFGEILQILWTDLAVVRKSAGLTIEDNSISETVLGYRNVVLYHQDSLRLKWFSELTAIAIVEGEALLGNRELVTGVEDCQLNDNAIDCRFFTDYEKGANLMQHRLLIKIQWDSRPITEHLAAVGIQQIAQYYRKRNGTFQVITLLSLPLAQVPTVQAYFVDYRGKIFQQKN